MMRFIAHFHNEIFEGAPLGSPQSGWNLLPDKPIRRLEYVLVDGDRLVLSGYEAYLHMVEVVQRPMEDPIVANVLLMGKRGDRVVCYCVRAFQEKEDDLFKVGDVLRRVRKWGEEYRGRPASGWRRGLVSAKCSTGGSK
jgi:hypothetical protein